jgi:hypothetical protein
MEGPDSRRFGFDDSRWKRAIESGRRADDGPHDNPAGSVPKA